MAKPTLRPARLLLTLVSCLASETALAEEDPALCIKKHADGQVLAKSGKLIEAQKLFESCAVAECPKVIQTDCKNLGKTVTKTIPTLRLTAIDGAGRVLDEARFELDGVALSPTDASAAVAVNPGDRRVRLTAPGHPAAEVTITVREREKDRLVAVQFAPLDPAAKKARTLGQILAGVGAFATASFVAFGISGYLDERDLVRRDLRSRNRADLAAVDRMRQKYVAADVSLGIGLVSLGVATYLLLVTKESVPQHSTRTRFDLDLRGFQHGFGASIRGAF
ncbi:MAG TPA: hypothetical protein VKP30_01120 [Polyangiaceae bacterium]|nr:hypothetical protein [Polyangiaceae bacterium]